MAILKIIAEIGRFSAPLLFPRSLAFGKYKVARSFRIIFEHELPRKIEELEKYKQGFSVLLSRLKNQGLIERKGPRKQSIWIITEKGKKILQSKEQARQERKLPSDGKTRLIIFDIPESEKGKRNWLRAELVAYGYSMLQKSVWWGNRPLPEKLFEDINDLGILGHVHIFGLGERGTLKKIK